jgi:hypothetical protein
MHVLAGPGTRIVQVITADRTFGSSRQQGGGKSSHWRMAGAGEFRAPALLPPLKRLRVLY